MYECIICEYLSNRKDNYERHIKSVRHKANKRKIEKTQPYKCSCGNTYKYQSSLSRHKSIKNCEKNQILKDESDINEEIKKGKEKDNIRIEDLFKEGPNQINNLQNQLKE